jgi:hypothetical protein
VKDAAALVNTNFPTAGLLGATGGGAVRVGPGAGNVWRGEHLARGAHASRARSPEVDLTLSRTPVYWRKTSVRRRCKDMATTLCKKNYCEKIRRMDNCLGPKSPTQTEITHHEENDQQS